MSGFQCPGMFVDNLLKQLFGFGRLAQFLLATGNLEQGRDILG